MLQPTENMKFNVIIIGAGIAGLGAAVGLSQSGHQVTVLEGATEISEVGSGIQIPPNCIRVFDAYGIAERFEKVASKPKEIRVLRYENGDLLNPVNLAALRNNYEYPYWLIHRADYQRVLLQAAVEAGAAVRTNCRVERVDDETVTVALKSGELFSADLIIGADGIRSRVRDTAVVPEEVVAPLKSGFCAYRAMVPAQKILSDPEVAHLMKDIAATLWIGYRRHVIMYPIRDDTILNVFMAHPGDAKVGKWSEPGNIDEMRETYSRFDPVVRRVLSHVDGCLNWVLADLPQLPRYVSPVSQRVVIIGDAAHAMFPYLAQGAAQGIEDGACIANELSKCKTREEIGPAMINFQCRRKRRCETIQKGTRQHNEMFHYPDGPDQEERDNSLRNIRFGVGSPNQWSDPVFQKWLFNWNAFSD